MKPIEQRIRELEDQRKTLNQKLMDATDAAEANAVERELWAVRTAIAHYKSLLKRERDRQTTRKPTKPDRGGKLTRPPTILENSRTPPATEQPTF